jgi:hypothetical protein
MIKNMFKVFILSLSGTTIGSTIFITLFEKDATLNYLFLWQMIIIAVGCALGNVIFVAKRELTKGEIKIRFILHYVYISLIVIGGAHFFDWINIRNITDIGMMVVLIAIIYTSVTTAMFKNDSKEAEDLNKKLSKYNKREE